MLKVKNSALKYNDLGFWDVLAEESISYTKNGHELILSFEEKSFWYQHRNQIIRNVVKNYLPGEMLDVGGGNGFVSKMLQEIVPDVIMIEPGIDGVLNAKSRDIKNVYRGTIDSLNIQSNTVEAVGLFDVLEHIQDDNSFLIRVNKILKEQGLLFITVPANKNLWSTFDENVGHYRRYNIKELSSLLNNTSFKVLYSTYFFSPILLPLYISRSYFNRRCKEKQRSKEHVSSNSSSIKLLSPFFYLEKLLISKRVFVSFGSSCLVVAKKVMK